MTLAAGILAFVAVQLQMRNQRRAVRQEQERQKKAVATAVLFEIDGFYRSHLRDPRKLLERIDPIKDNLPGIRSVGPTPFPVYLGNASKIGELNMDNVQAIVHFYSAANSYLSILRDYKNSLDRADRAKLLSMTPRGSPDLSSLADEAQARLNLKHMKEALPELIRFAWLVCYYLCRSTGNEFEFPTVGVAAEPISMKEFESSSESGVREGVHMI